MSKSNKTFKFDLVSPEKVVASQEASMVVIPGSMGDFGVLPKHAPMLASLRAGVISIHLPTGEINKVFVSGGFADVSEELCSVLVEEAVNLNDLNAERLGREMKALHEELETCSADTEEFKVLSKKIDIIQSKINVAV